MTRTLRIAGAQMAGTQKADPRRHTLDRLIALLEQAAADRATLVVFPELAFTTFFPRWLIPTTQELDTYFERDMPNAHVQPLFTRARELNIGFNIGYAELTPEGQRFNTSIIINRDGTLLGKYRKIHLPGSVEPREGARFQQLEKRYFDYGDLGFPTFRAPAFANGILGMLICNDRRWPEAFRVLGLQSVDMIFCGYNTPVHHPAAPDHDRLGQFHNELCLQSGAYQNSSWVVGIAKAGNEEGVDMIAGSCIIAPNGEIVARSAGNGDEVIAARCDLDLGLSYRNTTFNFALHRRPEHYRMIVERTGTHPPPWEDKPANEPDRQPEPRR